MPTYKEGARDPRKDASVYTVKNMRKYVPILNKKMADKSLDIRTIMAKTNATGFLVLDRLQDVPFYELAVSVYMYCRDNRFVPIAKEFEKLVEWAGINPDRFMQGLHSFFNLMAAKVKKDELLTEYFQFIGFFARLRYTKFYSGINPNVILAYTDLIINSLEYLRPSKFDLKSTVVGLMTNGEVMTALNPFPYDEISGWEGLVDSISGKEKNHSIADRYAKYGNYEVQTNEDAQRRGRMSRLSEGVKIALLPYINEYTFDIYPTSLFDGDMQMLRLLNCSQVDLPDLESKLSRRRRTLPTNGVHIEFQDPSEQLKSLLLKEIVCEDSVYLLYKLSLENGDLSGYYDTAENFFFSVTIESDKELEPIGLALKSVILFCYATNVLDDDLYTDDKFKENFRNFIFPIEAKSFGRGGALKNTYDSNGGDNSRRLNPKYEEQTTAVNGYIRKLPAGATASEEALERAMRLGYLLAPDETYVSPFIKSVFVLKDKDEIDRELKRRKDEADSSKES